MACLRLGTLVYNVLEVVKVANASRLGKHMKLTKTQQTLRAVKNLTHRINKLWQLKDINSFQVWHQVVQSFKQASQLSLAYAKSCKRLTTSTKLLDQADMTVTKVTSDACVLQKLLNQTKAEYLKTRMQVGHALCVLKCLPAVLSSKLESIQQEKLLLKSKACAVDMKLQAAKTARQQAAHAVSQTQQVHQDAHAALCCACQELSTICIIVGKRLHEQASVDEFMRRNKYAY